MDGGILDVFLRERDSLLRYLGLRGATPDEAEDILHELYLKLGDLRVGPIGQPKAYLFKMATNAFFLTRRSLIRRARREEGWMDAVATADGTDARPSAEESLIARERLDAVRRAIADLPERTQFVLRRFRLDGASQRAIADEIGISVSAVEKHLQRAYRVLMDIRAQLDADSGEPRTLTNDGDANEP